MEEKSNKDYSEYSILYEDHPQYIDRNGNF